MANDYDANFKEQVVARGTEFLSEELALVEGVSMDASGDPGNKGDSVAVTPYASRTASDKTASFTKPDATDADPNAIKVSLDYYKKSDWDLTGSDYSNNNLSYSFENQLKENIRAVVYDVNAKLAALWYKIPYFAGTTTQSIFSDGTNPTLNNLADINKVLRDNRVPMGNRKLLLNSTEEANYFKCSGVQNRNQAGIDDSMRRAGIMGYDAGLYLKAEQQIVTTTSGPSIGTSAVAKAGTAVAATATSFVATAVGAVTFYKGDIIAIAGVGQFAVQADTTATDADMTITIDRPLGTALAGSEAITIPTGYGVGSQNIAGDLRGYHLFSRLDKLVLDGLDDAKMVLPITHPSGLTLLFCQYGGYGKAKWEVSLMYGVNVVQSALLCRAIGV